jgi:hypothetical protein
MDDNSAARLQLKAHWPLNFIQAELCRAIFVDAKMEEINSALSGLNETVVLWVAGSVAAIFVLAILFDSRRRARARARTLGHSGAAIAEANYPSGFFKRMRFICRSLGQEITKRQRQNERERKRSK